MYFNRDRYHILRFCFVFLAILQLFIAPLSYSKETAAKNQSIAVGPQYDSTHVYVAEKDLQDFLNSFIATFGGQYTKPITTNVLPVPSRTKFSYIRSPVGMLSVFAYETKVPYPFGQERYGYLVTDMDQAIQAARKAGAEVVVEPFKDAIGRDAVIQWNGGVKMQLYWHSTPPSYPPLENIQENRIYISKDRADEFIHAFLAFSQGKVLEDNRNADASEIGRKGDIFRRIRIESSFGKMQVLVTDGHLPYPFGYEITGYQVKNLNDTLTKAKASGVKILSTPNDVGDRISAIIEFPGGYIAEVHEVTKHETS